MRLSRQDRQVHVSRQVNWIRKKFIDQIVSTALLNMCSHTSKINDNPLKTPFIMEIFEGFDPFGWISKLTPFKFP